MNLFKRVPRWLMIATIGIVPVVIALVNSLRGGAILVGDRAVFALLVKDAATGSFPSVGQYSWHGWNHPGALIFYVFAPFHWLSGGAAWGLFLGVAVYSCALLVAISWLGYRLRGIWGSALGVAALLAYWVSVGRIASVDAWTPYLALPLFILFLLAVLGVTERDRPSMWMMWISGAIAVQVHVGYLPIVGLVGLVACIVFWWTGGNQRSITRPLATSILLFAPYVFDLRQSVRNVGDLARYFVTANEPTIGFSRALEVMSFEMSPQATWLAGPSEVGLIGEAPSSSLIWFIALVVCLCAATVWVWRSSEGSLRRRFLNSAPVVWALLVAGTIAVAQVRGYLFPYVVLWRSVIVIFVVAWIVGVVLAHTTVIRQPWVTVVAIGLFVLNLIGASLPAADTKTVTTDAESVHRAIMQAVKYDELNPADGSILLKLGDGGLVGLYPALVYDFEERGIASGIEPGIEWVFGDRVLESEAAAVWMVCDSGIAFSLLASQPEAIVVSQITPFDQESETRVRELQQTLTDQLQSIGQGDFHKSLDSPLVALALQDFDVDQDAAAELAGYNAYTPEPGFRFGIVAFPADSIPELWWSMKAIS
ncbi:MAG: hypothetical protein RL628_266 [Actinomycetota bacterium]|jgi:hypothetical protein